MVKKYRSSIKRKSEDNYWLRIGLSCLLLFFGLKFLMINHYTPTFSDPSQAKSESENNLVLSSPPSFEITSPVANSRVGQPLTEIERQQISRLLGYTSVPNYQTKLEKLPLFILHDTAGKLSRETLEAQKQQTEGPYGDGIAVYILREGPPVIKRPQFFSPYRPTAAAYEKALDILPENQRDQKVRQIWSFLNSTAQERSLNKVVANIPNVDGIPLLKRSQLWLNSPSERAFARYRNTDGGKTTGLWTGGYICGIVANNQDIALNWAKSPEMADNLQQVCQELEPALSESRLRVASGVNIELLQIRGSDCWTSNYQVRYYNSLVSHSSRIQTNKLIPLQTRERPAYTESQYQYLAKFYLWAALQAGYYPQITTHFWIDQGKVGQIGDHCDPRGINLTHLYQHISELLGHPWGTLYGIEPQYGVSPELGDNVWWSESVLGFSPKI